MHLAGWPETRHRLWPNRYWERRHGNDRAMGGRSSASERRDHCRTTIGSKARRRSRSLHGRPAIERECSVHDRDGGENAFYRARITDIGCIAEGSNSNASICVGANRTSSCLKLIHEFKSALTPTARESIGVDLSAHKRDCLIVHKPTNDRNHVGARLQAPP